MLQTEKIFEKIEPINHSIGNYFIDNKIRIKDRHFSIKSIYKIAQHLKWMRKEKLAKECKIIIDSDSITDQAMLTLFENIVYFVLEEWNLKISYRFTIKKNLIAYQIFKRSILYKFNNKKINLEEFKKLYTKRLTIERDHFRKVCENTEENRIGNFISKTMDEVDTFLKVFEFDDEYRNELSEVIVEIIDNALKHSKGDCILTLNVLNNEEFNYKYVDVAVVVIDDIFIGKEIIEYINKKDKTEYSQNNKIVLEAYNNHKKFFNENYNINNFAMISAFQKYVTTRKKYTNTGGTGLTTLIKALSEKSTQNFCYAISGGTNLIFKKEYLNLNKVDLIGFNKSNSYIEQPPDDKIVNINKFDMNVNVYNLQFILKGEN